MPELSFAELLRRLREEKPLTQGELAKAAGLSERAVSDIELGKTLRPHPSTVNRLADALGLTGEIRVAFTIAARTGSAIVNTETVQAETVQAETAAHPAVPRTLPRDIRSFTGREPELKILTRAADDTGPVGVYVIEGMGGLGKTSLALRAGHELADRYPDGQLFVDLHGYTPDLEALSAATALRSLLHALGVSDEFIPEQLEDCAALYRSRLAGTKTLIILDNASSPGQIRPLLPGTAGSLVLITSRRSLAELDDAQVIALDALSPVEAAALFQAVAGRGEPGADDPGLREIVELCGRLPLAIRIVAARLSRRKALLISDVLADLRTELGRLVRLEAIDPRLTAVFETSVRHLGQPERDIFHRLALIPGPDFEPAAVASLADWPVDAARRSLESLLDHNLLVQHVADRYRLHDLVRIYARTAAAPADTATPVRRLLDFYLRLARAADRLFERRIPAADTEPGGAAVLDGSPQWTARQAQAWVAAEVANLDAAVGYAAEHGYPGHVTGLATALGHYLRGHGPWPMAIGLQERALGVAVATGDLPGQAAALGFLGVMHRQAGGLTAAGDYFGRALSRYEEIGQPYGQAAMLVELGVIHRLTGKHASAAGYLNRALGLYTELGSRHGQAGTLTELGGLRRQLGDFAGSEEALTSALDHYHQLENRGGQAAALGYLGSTMLTVGQYERAKDALKAALDLHVQLDDPFNEANSHLMLGRVYTNTGKLTEAADSLGEASRIYGMLGERRGQAGARAFLAALQTRTGEYDGAAENLRVAVDLFRAVKDPGGEAEALNYLGALAIARSQPGQAREHYEHALRLAQTIGSAMDEAAALEGIATAWRLAGDYAQAAAYLQQALTIYQAMPSPADAERVKAELAQLPGNE